MPVCMSVVLIHCNAHLLLPLMLLNYCHLLPACLVPGLHRPTGEDAFTQELQRFVTEKIKYDNVIILDVMTADLATAAGKSNLSLGHNLAFGVDRQCSRTLTVLTKADRLGKTPDKISDALTAAVVRSKGKHGCVMVSLLDHMTAPFSCC